MATQPLRRPALTFAFYALMLSLGCYFAFAAVQGDFGLFKRVEIEAEMTERTAYREALEAERARLENLTTRLSDDNLDLDLLDERARAVLGQLRVDEIVIR